MIADVQFLQYIQLDNTLRPEQKCMLFGNVYAKPMVDRINSTAVIRVQSIF